jgi:hypothetical protein
MNYLICSIKTKITKALIFSAFVFSAVTQAADFGVANWGMTMEDVKQLETRSNLTPFSKNDYLIYSVKLPGIESARIVYQFSNGQLVHGRFIFSPSNPLNVTMAVNHYQSIKTLMTRQYGPPNSDEMLTIDNTVFAPENTANELASNRLILKSSWQSSTSTISHQLAWNNDKPHHQLHYKPSATVSITSTSDAF